MVKRPQLKWQSAILSVGDVMSWQLRLASSCFKVKICVTLHLKKKQNSESLWFYNIVG